MAEVGGILLIILAGGYATATVKELPAMPRSPLTIDYPANCGRSAKPSETVSLKFDIGIGGVTENISVVSSSNACFDTAAIKSVKNWQFWLQASAGAPAKRQGFDVAFQFDQNDPAAVAKPDIRRKVKHRLERVRSDLGQDRDPQKALAELADIEHDYGETFTTDEKMAHAILRATALTDAGDLDGALADLKLIDSMSPGKKDDEAQRIVVSAISTLETSLSRPSKRAEISN